MERWGTGVTEQQNDRVTGLKGLTGWLVRRVLGPGVSPASGEGRSRLGECEGVVSTALSILLALVKGVLAWFTSSISLLADALNNLADIGSSLIVVFGFRVVRKPRDREHPYGHGRMEPVATLVLAVILIGVGIEVARAGIRRLLHPLPFSVPWWVLLAVGITILIKFWLAGFARRLARLTQSATLRADAWNHTYDIATTSLVLIALICSRWGWDSVDGWAGLGVSVFIGYTGVQFVRQAVHTLIGEAPSHDELHQIQQIGSSVRGVYGVHDVIIHSYGDRKLISLHAEVDANQTALEAHHLAEQVEQAVTEAVGAKVTAHVDPVDHSHPLYGLVSATLKDIFGAHQDVISFHDLRVEGMGERYDLSLDLVVCTEVSQQSFEVMLDRLAKRIRARLPNLDTLDLGIETEYSSDQEFRKVYEAPLPRPSAGAGSIDRAVDNSDEPC